MGSDKMILYLHGLNSAGSSGKAAVFRSRLEPVDVLSPTYPAHRPALAVRYLSGVLERLLPLQEPLLLVGSSMGGFYGQHLARHFPVDHLVMINPVLRPWDLLLDYRIAASIYAGIGGVELFEGGSHTFEHMDEALEIVTAIHERLR